MTGMLFILLLLPSMAHAVICPDLTGDYICPAHENTQPESPLNVDQQTWQGVTEYTYTFENLHPPGRPREPLIVKTWASVQGETDDEGVTYRCAGRLLTIFDPANSKSVQQHFLEDRTRDYVVVFRNRDGSEKPREVQRCVSRFPYIGL